MFALFLDLPLEIQFSILDQCPPNDATCLSLACKHLYNLHTARSSTTTTPNTHSLDRVDILVQPPPPPRRPTKIDNPFYHLMDPQPQLHSPQDHHPWHSIPTCCPLFLRDHMSRRGHQGGCKTRGCTGCCPCVSCPLWAQLKGWMPRDLKYCATCRKFTLRNKKKYKGRCSHTWRTRRRVVADRLWTYRKGCGGFSRKLWKKFYTETNLARAMGRYEAPRAHNTQYGLREKPKPTEKRVMHVEDGRNRRYYPRDY